MVRPGAGYGMAGRLRTPEGTAMTFVLGFEVDDLSRSETRGLVERHLRGMHANSPACSVHAFDIDRLKQPGVTFWSGWLRERIAVIGALKRIDAENGEIKSMRVADEWLGQGVGRLMLKHIIREAQKMGMKTLWLETGSAPAFEPALKLYQSAGFSFCGPFGGYKEDPFSRFMTRAI
jgi:putative acetyltransferase